MSTSVLSLWPLLLLRALVLQVRAYPTLWGRVSASDYAHDKPTATVPWWRDLLAWFAHPTTQTDMHAGMHSNLRMQTSQRIHITHTHTHTHTHAHSYKHTQYMHT